MFFWFLFGDFDWSIANLNQFLHFDKNPGLRIFDVGLDFTVWRHLANSNVIEQ